jgi:hypothetical protein
MSPQRSNVGTPHPAAEVVRAPSVEVENGVAAALLTPAPIAAVNWPATMMNTLNRYHVAG